MTTTIRQLVRDLTPTERQFGNVGHWMAEHGKNPYATGCLNRYDWCCGECSCSLPWVIFSLLPNDMDGDIPMRHRSMRYVSRTEAIHALEHALREAGVIP